MARLSPTTRFSYETAPRGQYADSVTVLVSIVGAFSGCRCGPRLAGQKSPTRSPSGVISFRGCAARRGSVPPTTAVLQLQGMHQKSLTVRSVAGATSVAQRIFGAVTRIAAGTAANRLTSQRAPVESRHVGCGMLRHPSWSEHALLPDVGPTLPCCRDRAY